MGKDRREGGLNDESDYGNDINAGIGGIWDDGMGDGGGMMRDDVTMDAVVCDWAMVGVW